MCTASEYLKRPGSAPMTSLYGEGAVEGRGDRGDRRTSLSWMIPLGESTSALPAHASPVITWCDCAAALLPAPSLPPPHLEHLRLRAGRLVDPWHRIAKRSSSIISDQSDCCKFEIREKFSTFFRAAQSTGPELFTSCFSSGAKHCARTLS